MWRRGGYRSGFLNRFGLFRKLPAPAPGVKRIWLQAVSVGELLAAAPLIQRLRNAGHEIILTTTTSTGFALARRRHAEDVTLTGVFPLDFWATSALAWRRLRPHAVILFESELWPEHLNQAGRRGVPVFLVNARLSERSFNRYMRLRVVARPLLRPLTTVLAASPTDEKRHRRLRPGADVHLTGNLKVDFDPEPLLDDGAKRALAAECGFIDVNGLSSSAPPPVLLGASTWPGEEAALVEAWKQLSAENPALCLLLVPRHAERRREVAADLRAAGIDPVLRTDLRAQARPAPAGTRVYVADTTGELRRFTQLADVVFVGKSLPPHRQGQTPIEAAGYAKPVFFGPGMKEFSDIAAALVREGAAEIVPEAGQLTACIRPVLGDSQEHARRGAAARRWFEANRGAADRAWKRIRAGLESNDRRKAPDSSQLS